MSLYKISEKYNNVLNEMIFNDETGEVNETSLKIVNAVSAELHEKCIAVATFIKNLEAEKEMVNRTKKEITDRESKLEKKVKWFENYLYSNMERSGISSISSSPYFEIKIKKCPLSVDITSEALIPKDYINTKVTFQVDKVKIKNDLINGYVIPGVSLKQNVRLQIK